MRSPVHGRAENRRNLVVAMAMVLALVGGAAERSVAAKRRPRTASSAYTVPGARAFPLGAGIDIAACATSTALGCVTFRTRPRDSYIQVRVTDATNTGPVLASVAQDLDGDGVVEVDEHYRAFCGKTGRLRIRRSGTDVAVFVYEAWGGAFVTYGMIPIAPYARSCGGGVATTGTVRATFWR